MKSDGGSTVVNVYFPTTKHLVGLTLQDYSGEDRGDPVGFSLLEGKVQVPRGDFGKKFVKSSKDRFEKLLTSLKINEPRGTYFSVYPHFFYDGTDKKSEGEDGLEDPLGSSKSLAYFMVCLVNFLKTNDILEIKSTLEVAGEDVKNGVLFFSGDTIEENFNGLYQIRPIADICEKIGVMKRALEDSKALGGETAKSASKTTRSASKTTRSASKTARSASKTARSASKTAARALEDAFAEVSDASVVLADAASVVKASAVSVDKAFDKSKTAKSAAKVIAKFEKFGAPAAKSAVEAAKSAVEAAKSAAISVKFAAQSAEEIAESAAVTLKFVKEAEKFVKRAMDAYNTAKDAIERIDYSYPVAVEYAEYTVEAAKSAVEAAKSAAQSAADMLPGTGDRNWVLFFEAEEDIKEIDEKIKDIDKEIEVVIGPEKNEGKISLSNGGNIYLVKVDSIKDIFDKLYEGNWESELEKRSAGEIAQSIIEKELPYPNGYIILSTRSGSFNYVSEAARDKNAQKSAVRFRRTNKYYRYEKGMMKEPILALLVLDGGIVDKESLLGIVRREEFVNGHFVETPFNWLPQVHCAKNFIDGNDKPYVIYQWAEGKPLADVSFDGKEKKREKIYAKLGECFAELHDRVQFTEFYEQFTVESVNKGISSWSEFFIKKMDKEFDRQKNKKILSKETKERIRKEIKSVEKELMSGGKSLFSPVLVHNDVYGKNVIYNEESESDDIYIIDWDNLCVDLEELDLMKMKYWTVLDENGKLVGDEKLYKKVVNAYNKKKKGRKINGRLESLYSIYWLLKVYSYTKDVEDNELGGVKIEEKDGHRDDTLVFPNSGDYLDHLKAILDKEPYKKSKKVGRRKKSK